MEIGMGPVWYDNLNSDLMVCISTGSSSTLSYTDSHQSRCLKEAVRKRIFIGR